MGEAPKILESPEEVLSTLRADGKRRWLYPVTSRGQHFVQRRVVGWALMVTFIVMPIIKIGGNPALFFDIMSREFHFFGLTLYPTDTLLLALFGLISLLSVFLVSALLGRVWCGWACPQTVYLEFLYRPIEAFFEGKPNARRRRDEGPATPERLMRKGGKWTVFTLIAFVLANTFVAYFVGWDQLIIWMQGKPSEHWPFFVMMAGTTALILFDFGYFREQMCTITCPYARFQSVLQDRDSLIVSYDPSRGEPRGRRGKKERQAEKAGEAIGLGDCVDCFACVRTCPTGIDIRDGLQMECIACTQCVDACNSIMEGLGKPEGLIRYTSENVIEKKKARILRPRIIGYAVVLTGLLIAFTTVLVGRNPIDFNIGRAGKTPFAMLPDGNVSNRLRFRVQNRTGDPGSYTFTALKPEGVQVKVVGRPKLEVEPGEMERVEAWIIVPPAAFTKGKTTATFRVQDDAGRSSDVTFNLLGPST